MDLYKTFIRNRHYLKKAGVVLECVEGDHSPYICINNPIIIASFAGFVKNRHAADQIYFRGESGNHRHIVPSLFRDRGGPLQDNKIIQNRWKAYRELKDAVFTHFQTKVSRFKKEDIDNLFQHYGIKSPVIDFVDNIYVAIWFAMEGSRDGFGFIRILNTTSEKLIVSDLRKTHSSLSLRLHTQHGLTAKKKVKTWNKSNICYDEFEVARIKFPIKKNIESGVLFSRQNIFPDETLDNTLKILKNDKWLQEKITLLERKYHLHKGDLGSIQ
jgi:hypothetical protein